MKGGAIVLIFNFQMISFVGLTLIHEYLIHVHYPKFYYWNGEMEYLNKIQRVQKTKDKDKGNKLEQDKAA